MFPLIVSLTGIIMGVLECLSMVRGNIPKASTPSKRLFIG